MENTQNTVEVVTGFKIEDGKLMYETKTLVGYFTVQDEEPCAGTLTLLKEGDSCRQGDSGRNQKGESYNKNVIPPHLATAAQVIRQDLAKLRQQKKN